MQLMIEVQADNVASQYPKTGDVFQSSTERHLDDDIGFQTKAFRGLQTTRICRKKDFT